MKPLGYEKKAFNFFEEIYQLVQYFQSAVTEHCTIYNIIIFVVALNFLYNDFEMTTSFIFYSSNKELEEIQQIVTFIEVVNMEKRTTGQIANLAIIAKKKIVCWQKTPKPKTNEKCLNHRRKENYAWDYDLPTSKEKPEDAKNAKEAKQSQ